jgi:hypothetical protein
MTRFGRGKVERGGDVCRWCGSATAMTSDDERNERVCDPTFVCFLCPMPLNGQSRSWVAGKLK